MDGPEPIPPRPAPTRLGCIQPAAGEKEVKKRKPHRREDSAEKDGVGVRNAGGILHQQVPGREAEQKENDWWA